MAAAIALAVQHGRLGGAAQRYDTALDDYVARVTALEADDRVPAPPRLDERVLSGLDGDYRAAARREAAVAGLIDRARDLQEARRRSPDVYLADLRFGDASNAALRAAQADTARQVRDEDSAGYAVTVLRWLDRSQTAARTYLDAVTAAVGSSPTPYERRYLEAARDLRRTYAAQAAEVRKDPDSSLVARTERNRTVELAVTTTRKHWDYIDSGLGQVDAEPLTTTVTDQLRAVVAEAPQMPSVRAASARGAARARVAQAVEVTPDPATSDGGRRVDVLRSLRDELVTIRRGLSASEARAALPGLGDVTDAITLFSAPGEQQDGEIPSEFLAAVDFDDAYYAQKGGRPEYEAFAVSEAEMAKVLDSNARAFRSTYARMMRQLEKLPRPALVAGQLDQAITAVRRVVASYDALLPSTADAPDGATTENTEALAGLVTSQRAVARVLDDDEALRKNALTTFASFLR